MRILILTPTFLPAIGGAELVILQVFRRLASAHHVRVLTPHLSMAIIEASGSKEYDFLLNFSVSRYVDRLSFMKLRGHKLSKGLIPPFSISAVTALQNEIRRFQPDIVNVHYTMPTGLAAHASQRFWKVPTVLTFNGRDVPGPGAPPFWKYWHRWIGRSCANCTFVSKYCRDVVFGAASQIGRVIYNGVEDPLPRDESQVMEIRKQIGIQKNAYVLLALQRLDPLKRIDVIIKSIPRILRKGLDVCLVIGGKGPDKERLMQISDSLKINRCVKFVGFIPDKSIPAFFHLADIFVFHSTYETFGMVLAEAMNYGKAVVSVDNTAIPEVVDDGVTGLLVPTMDHRSFAEAVSHLLENKAVKNNFGYRGRRKVETYFRWNSIAKQYEDIFYKTLREQRMSRHQRQYR